MVDKVNQSPDHEETKADPNISGKNDTTDTLDWSSGPMDGWVENDDYRRYVEAGRSPESALGIMTYDGDYDDNGGIPTAIGEAYGLDDGTTIHNAHPHAEHSVGIREGHTVHDRRAKGPAHIGRMGY